MDPTDRATGARKSVRASHVLGCDGANGVVRRAICAELALLGFEQRWLVIDIGTSEPLNQWELGHQLCDSHRAGAYMLVVEVRYPWEFRLLPGETAADLATMDTPNPLICPNAPTSVAPGANRIALLALIATPEERKRIAP